MYCYYGLPDYNLDPPEYDERKTPCPVCDEECETIFMRECDEQGCEHCVDEKDAWEWLCDQGRLPEKDPESYNPVCPVCRKECEHYYVSDGEIVGCENCIEFKDAYEWYEAHDWFSGYD